MWIVSEEKMIDWNTVGAAETGKNGNNEFITLYNKNDHGEYIRFYFKKIKASMFIKHLTGLLNSALALPTVLEINIELEDLILGEFKTFDEFNNTGITEVSELGTRLAMMNLRRL